MSYDCIKKFGTYNSQGNRVCFFIIYFIGHDSCLYSLLYTYVYTVKMYTYVYKWLARLSHELSGLSHKQYAMLC